MNSILRALAAHWLLIALSTVACLLGGVLIIATSTPRYEGRARVVLDYIRPDPATGEVLPSKMLDAYLASQIGMLHDVRVAGAAAELMGWLDDPDILSAYAERPASDNRDLASWVAGIMIPRTRAQMVEGSNILEISYYGESKELARAAAEGLRNAYVQADVDQRAALAGESATRLAIRLTQVRSQLDALVAMQARISQETGVALGPRGRDQADIELSSLLERHARPVIASSEPAPSMAARDLAQARVALSVAEKSLGPNNPNLLQMRARVDSLAQRAASEETAQQSERRLMEAANAASQAQVEALKARVLEQRQPALKLRLLQDQIEVLKEEATNLSRAIIASRAAQTLKATSITPIGDATVDPDPVFPNRLLILGGTGGLGLILGGMVACLVEITGRRVRNPRHMENATGAVLLAVLPAMTPQKPRRRLFGRRKAPATSDVLEVSAA